MHHIGTQRIETNRLILRQFEKADAGAMFENWASDPDVTKYLTWPTHSDLSVTQWVVDSWVAEYDNLTYYNWGIVLKDTGMLIGNIAAVSVNESVDSVEIGYCMGKAWWGRGIMPEALSSVLDYFFDQMGVNRAEAYHDTNNPGSGRVMIKCGMQFEGVRRQSGRNNHGVCDMALYGILASDRKKG